MFSEDPVTENHVVPVHREMCKYTIIPSSPGPIENRVPLNPRIPLQAEKIERALIKPRALIGRYYITERGSAPVQYNGIV